MSLETAKKIAHHVFADKKDLAGRPYIEHLERVAKPFEGGLGYFNNRCEVVAWLYDVLEDDPNWNPAVLRCFFHDEIVEAVVALTKGKNESYKDYISRLSKNAVAKRVKIADLKDNMDITRLPELTEVDFKQLKKRHEAYLFLTAQ